MRFIKNEHHKVTSSFIYDIPEEDIVNTFGSIERFKEIASHFSDEEEWSEPAGASPTEDEETLFLDFLDMYSYDREDDWWTERKGGYEVTYEYDNDQDNQYYDDRGMLN